MAATQQQLDEAEAALHKLMTRGGVAQVRHGDRWVNYTPTKVADLRAYISQLRAQLSLPQVGRTRSRRVMF